MEPTHSEPGAPPTGYIRGAAGVGAEPPKIAAAVVWFTVSLLALLGIVLAVQAAHENSRHAALRDDGVAVSASIIRCVGQATGTGITGDGFTCYGSFRLDGVRRTDRILGSSRLYQPGAEVAAVVDPHHAGVLATRSSVANGSSRWRAYLGAAIVITLLALVVGSSTWRCRRRQVWRRPLAGVSS
ncbi:MAG TPA: hypothetical protein VHV79_14035 [Mycobacteriales bacterium]|nr:hypothetical protein [Mycobacteriales bacterium]